MSNRDWVEEAVSDLPESPESERVSPELKKIFLAHSQQRPAVTVSCLVDLRRLFVEWGVEGVVSDSIVKRVLFQLHPELFKGNSFRPIV